MDDPRRAYCNWQSYHRHYSRRDPEHLLDDRQLVLPRRAFLSLFPETPHVAYRPLLLTRLPSSVLTLCFIG